MIKFLFLVVVILSVTTFIAKLLHTEIEETRNLSKESITCANRLKGCIKVKGTKSNKSEKASGQDN